MYPFAEILFRRLRRLPWSVCAFLCLFAMAPASQAQNDPGRFEVRSASATLSSGVYYLDGRIEYRLSTDIREALDAGVPLTFRIDVEVIRIRRFWGDVIHASLRQRFQLEFHTLSARYIVVNLNSGEQTSYATLFAALNHLGRMDKLPIIDSALLDAGQDFDVRVRAVLDVERLSGPLRLLAFWRRDWSLASEWYRWPLVRD